MKISSSENFVETSGDFKETSFSISEKDTGLILEILRSKMYKNPIGSICREIASNCRDANREMGAPDAEILIRIIKPSKWVYNESAYIEFEDFGPGISPERMENVFCKYAASTKRTSDFFTGGFGLGAKTPFSYSDTFNIHTYVDGTEYIYVSSIDESNCGKVILVSKEPTERVNGTIIKIPIKNQEDLDAFYRESIKQTFFWKESVKIFFNGVIFSREEGKKKRFENEKFSLFDPIFLDRISFTGIHILIDGVFYPLEGIKDLSLPRMSDALLLLHFDNGELTVAGNRENLQYDSKTIEKLNQRIKEVEEFIVKEVVKEIDELPTYLDACLYVKKMNGNDLLKFQRIQNIGKANPPKWRSHEILDYIHFQTFEMCLYLPKGFYGYRELTHFSKKKDPGFKEIIGRDTFLIRSQQKDYLKRIRTYIETHKSPLVGLFPADEPQWNPPASIEDQTKLASLKSIFEENLNRWRLQRKKEKKIIGLFFSDCKEITEIEPYKETKAPKKLESEGEVKLSFLDTSSYKYNNLFYSFKEKKIIRKGNGIERLSSILVKKVPVLRKITPQEVSELRFWEGVLDKKIIFVRDDEGIIPSEYLLESHIKEKKEEIKETLYLASIIDQIIDFSTIMRISDFGLSPEYKNVLKSIEYRTLRYISITGREDIVSKFLTKKKIERAKQINELFRSLDKRIPLIRYSCHHEHFSHKEEYVKTFVPELF